MKYIFSIFFLFCLGCDNKINTVNFQLDELDIDKSPFIKYDNKIHHTNRFSIFKVKDSVLLFNISKSNSILIYNFNKAIFNEIILPEDMSFETLDAVGFKNQVFYYLVDKSKIYQYNYLNGKVEFHSEFNLDNDLYVSGDFYNSNLYNLNNSFYVSLSPINNDFNKYLLYNFEQDSIKGLIPNPKFESNKFNYFTDVRITNDNENVYFIFPVDDILYKYSLKDNSLKNKRLAIKGYLDFDIKKITDMLYVSDYSNNTAFNYKLFVDDKFVYLLSRNNSKQNGMFYISVFDKNLNLKNSIEIGNSVDPFYVYNIDQKIYIPRLYEEKISVYDFNTGDK